MPAWFMRRGDDPFTGSPFKVIVPARGGRKPASVISRVVLPAPLGPRTASTFLCRSVNVMSRADRQLPVADPETVTLEYGSADRRCAPARRSAGDLGGVGHEATRR